MQLTMIVQKYFIGPLKEFETALSIDTCNSRLSLHFVTISISYTQKYDLILFRFQIVMLSDRCNVYIWRCPFNGLIRGRVHRIIMEPYFLFNQPFSVSQYHAKSNFCAAEKE